MRKILIASAILVATIVPLSAADWMGSVAFSNGTPINFTATMKHGKGVAVTETGQKVNITRKGNAIRFDGNGISGRGTVKNGKVSGHFTQDNSKGTFSGRRK